MDHFLRYGMEVGIRNGVDFMTHKLQSWKIINRQVFYRGTSNKLESASGSTINNPPDYSSKFDSPEKVIEGMNNTKQGTPAWNAGQQQGNRRVVEYESLNIVGKGVPRDGNNFVTTKKVFAVYEDIGGGNYKLITMYPSF